jgi:hypothetical protein
MEACAPGMFLSCVYLIIFILPFNPSLNKRWPRFDPRQCPP